MILEIQRGGIAMKDNKTRKKADGTKMSSRILALILAILMVAGAAYYTFYMIMASIPH